MQPETYLGESLLLYVHSRYHQIYFMFTPSMLPQSVFTTINLHKKNLIPESFDIYCINVVPPTLVKN